MRKLSFPAIVILVFFFITIAVAVVLYVFFPGVHDSVNNFVSLPSKNNGNSANSLNSNICSPASDPTLAGLCSNSGYDCGIVDNGTCGSVSCGTCGENYTCESNHCVLNQSSISSCTPAANPTLLGVCGSQKCGIAQNGTCGNVTCGTCNSGYICSGGSCVQQQSQTIPPPPPLPS